MKRRTPFESDFRDLLGEDPDDIEMVVQPSAAGARLQRTSNRLKRFSLFQWLAALFIGVPLIGILIGLMIIALYVLFFLIGGLLFVMGSFFHAIFS